MQAKKIFWRQGPEAEAPYMWASKTTLRQIMESAHVTERSSALLVYWALCWLASDVDGERQGSNTFKANRGLIAYKCGLSVSTVKKRIKELELAGVIQVSRHRIKGTKENDTNTYRLCSSKRQRSVIRKAFLKPGSRTGSGVEEKLHTPTTDANTLSLSVPGGTGKAHASGRDAVSQK